MEDTKQIAKSQLIFAIPCAIVYTLAKFILFAIAYWTFTSDMGLDIHMTASKAVAIAYVACGFLFSLWRGV